MAGPDDGDQEMPERELAHQRARDRKRETRMVVDNAGIRRLLPAVRRKPAAKPKDGDADRPG